VLANLFDPSVDGGIRVFARRAVLGIRVPEPELGRPLASVEALVPVAEEVDVLLGDKASIAREVGAIQKVESPLSGDTRRGRACWPSVGPLLGKPA